MSTGKLLSFASLLDQVGAIEIPIIQRDYAQGRPEAADVRATFLGTLRQALSAPGEEGRLDLDFVYGSFVNDGHNVLHLLDGQQRLTTLFLLHWYLAQVAGEAEDFRQRCVREGRSRFRYATRPGSTEFMDALCTAEVEPASLEHPACNLEDLIADCGWFQDAWRHDPTVQSCLVMLSAIHDVFCGSQDLYARLVDPVAPRVVFHFLDLKHFGLSDDLYIKMNARGKPLTAFENFKAWLVERAGQGAWAEEFDLRIDREWIDFFWRLNESQDVEDLEAEDAKDRYDTLFLRFFYLVAFFDGCSELKRPYLFAPVAEREWLTLLREARGYVALREFEGRGALGKPTLMRAGFLLDHFCGATGKADEAVLRAAVSSKQGYDELVRLQAVLVFEEVAKGANPAEVAQRREDWRRITANLIANTRIDEPALAVAVVRGLKDLSQHAMLLTEYLSREVPVGLGFNTDQVKEECRKAALILEDPAWRSVFAEAESHWYLKGRVDFLLEASAVGSGAPDPASFAGYTERFARVITREILQHGDFLLQRALLSLYDYLPPAGSNHTFCTANATAFRDRAENWLAVFRDKRFVALLDAIGDDAATSLRDLIGQARCEDWRKYPIEEPSLIAYCTHRQVRRHSGDVYLLSRWTLRGYFAELRSLALEKRLSAMLASGDLPGVNRVDYEGVYGDADPYLNIHADTLYQLTFKAGAWQCHDAAGVAVPMPGVVADVIASGFTR
jgi:hypothetical protein